MIATALARMGAGRVGSPLALAGGSGPTRVPPRKLRLAPVRVALAAGAIVLVAGGGVRAGAQDSGAAPVNTATAADMDWIHKRPGPGAMPAEAAPVPTASGPTPGSLPPSAAPGSPAPAPIATSAPPATTTIVAPPSGKIPSRDPFNTTRRMINRASDGDPDAGGGVGAGGKKVAIPQAQVTLPKIALKGVIERARGSHTALLDIQGTGILLVKADDVITVTDQTRTVLLKIFRVDAQAVIIDVAGGGPFGTRIVIR